MKIILDSTAKFVELDGVPARVWQGTTDTGIPVHAFITRIVPETHEVTALKAFESELQECRQPTTVVEAIPLRMVL